MKRFFCIFFTLLFIFIFADIPSIKENITVEEWMVGGPFSVGAREGVSGVIIEREKIAEDYVSLSFLAEDASIKWQKIIATDGVLNISFDENVNWEELRNIFGIAGLLSSGFARSEIELSQKSRAIVFARGISGFSINNRSYIADSYGKNYAFTPVILDEGKNEIFFSFSGFSGRKSVGFLILPVEKDVFINEYDIITPDIRKGHSLNQYISVPVVNTFNDDITVYAEIVESDHLLNTRSEHHRINPLGILKIPVPIKTKGVFPTEYDEKEMRFQIDLHFKNKSETFTSSIRIRDADMSYKETFISRYDNSIQYYAVMPPKDHAKGKKYSLIFTLHGASVEAYGQVDAYKQKDWAFIVAPTNRRPYGFDWQDLGRMDALEVLDIIIEKYPIDVDRINLTGHSMGGHGSWHLGTLYPDLFSSLVPSAGWSNFQTYIPWTLQKSNFFADPITFLPKNQIMRMESPFTYLENMHDIPILIVHGRSDTNVPVYHARMFYQFLSDLGYDVKLHEEEGMDHWWSLPDTERTDCVDSLMIEDFFKDRTRVKYPKRIVLRTINPELNGKHYWLKVNKQTIPYAESRIVAEVMDDKIMIFEENVDSFTVFLDSELLGYKKIVFEINGNKINYNFKGNGPVSFTKKKNRFRISKPLFQNNIGPMMKIYDHPFYIVYSTQNEEIEKITRDQARMYSAIFTINANGFAPIIADNEITDDIANNYNLIIFGNTLNNSFLKKHARKIPVRFDGNSIKIAKDNISEKGAIAFISENPVNAQRRILVFAGNDDSMQSHANSFTPLHSGAGLPDYIIFNEEIRTKAWGGVRYSGFWD